jgi:hypothetical protein
LCWFINSYDILKDQVHILGQAVKEGQLSGTVWYALLVCEVESYALLCCVSNNLSTSTAYIPQDFILHIHIVLVIS